MIEFEIIDKLIGLADINLLEQDLQVVFPDDYKEHMLQYNGGIVKSSAVYFKEFDTGIVFESLHPIKNGDDTLEDLYALRRDYLPEKYISIGYINGGNLCISLTEDNHGAIYAYYPDGENKLLAASFKDFLSNLIDYGDDVEF